MRAPPVLPGMRVTPPLSLRINASQRRHIGGREEKKEPIIADVERIIEAIALQRLCVGI